MRHLDVPALATHRCIHCTLLRCDRPGAVCDEYLGYLAAQTAVAPDGASKCDSV
jgi:hypothetical protein